MNKNTPMRRGFTLIELLLFAAIFSIVIISVIAAFVAVVDVQSKESASSDVQAQAGFLAKQIQYYVQSARLVDMTLDTATSTLKLRETSSTLDPTTISLSAGSVILQQGAGSPQSLTTAKVTVTSLSFTRHFNLNSTSSIYGTESVSYTFTMAANSTNREQEATSTFQSSATVFGPVPKIALVQQAALRSLLVGAGTLSPSYSGAVTAGDLLVVAVLNQGTSSVAVGVSDTANNTWTLVASSTYPSYNERTSIFIAKNASTTGSPDALSVTFIPGVNYPGAFLLEYRGASTSSPFDAFATQNQASSSALASGSAIATSSPELLLGILEYAATVGTTTPGFGYTTEQALTAAAATYTIADQPLFVTGPVSASWAYSNGSPPVVSSTADIVTFQ